jgi:hypothetical protein
MHRLSVLGLLAGFLLSSVPSAAASAYAYVYVCVFSQPQLMLMLCVIDLLRQTEEDWGLGVCKAALP